MSETNSNCHGVLGRPDPVVWQAMQDVMIASSKYAHITKSLADAHQQGNVELSIALCREQLMCEQSGNEAIAVCTRVGGERASQAALRFGYSHVTKAPEVTP